VSDAKRTEGVPHDRLTRLADVMAAALEAAPEYREGDKAIMFLDDGKRGGLVLHGYDDDTEAMDDLIVHLQAIFEVNGKTLMVVPVREG
jgi:hypothetical protein